LIVRFSEQHDIGIGAAVVLFGFALLFWFHSDSDVGKALDGYPLHASYHRSDGLSEGADVRLAGIKAGYVSHMDIDKSFQAHVTLQLQDGIKVPSDSAAVIHTDGLFGGKYIELEPGGALDYLESGDTISFTQDSLVVEDLLERLTAIAKSRNTKCAETLSTPPKGLSTPAAKADQKSPSLLLPLDQGTP